jgi:hypothetical protein
LCHAVWQTFTSVSEVLSTLIIRVMSKPYVRRWFEIWKPVDGPVGKRVRIKCDSQAVNGRKADCVLIGKLGGRAVRQL